VILKADSAEAIVARMKALLDNATGISYSYDYYNFNIIDDTGKDCCVKIFMNAGPEKKTESKFYMAPECLEDNLEFVVEFNDLTRFFSNLFTYMVQNYYAETIARFSTETLSYWLYCPDYHNSE
jgi:hypothetical protein